VAEVAKELRTDRVREALGQRTRPSEAGGTDPWALEM
jgi:hypothetical protein